MTPSTTTEKPDAPATAPTPTDAQPPAAGGARENANPQQPLYGGRWGDAGTVFPSGFREANQPGKPAPAPQHPA